MAGRGRIGEVSALHHPGVFMFRDETWVPAMEPLHTDKPRMAGVGLGMRFAVWISMNDHGWQSRPTDTTPGRHEVTV